MPDRAYFGPWYQQQPQIPGVAAQRAQQPGPQLSPGCRIPAAVTPSRPQGFQVFQGWNECIQALVAKLERSLLTVNPDPTSQAPFFSRSILKRSRTVVNVPAAWDPVANAGGLAIQAAENAFDGGVVPATVSLVTPPETAPPFSPQAVFSYQGPEGTVTIFKTWGISVDVGSLSAVRGNVQIQRGPNTGTDAPDPYASSPLAGNQQGTLVVVPENGQLTYKVQNTDSASAVLVTFVAQGWVIPINEYRELLKSLNPHTGYGPACDTGD